MTLSVIFSGAALVLCGFFFIYFTIYIKRRTERANLLGDYQDEVNKFIADLDSATDRNLTLLEDRITVLKKLQEDVDKRIAVLSREQDRKRSSDAVYTSLGRQMKVSVQEPEITGAAAQGSGSPLEPAAEIAATTHAATVEKAVPVTVIEPKESKASFADRVAELSRTGFTPDLIAARLGVSISEVELAIAVSRRKQSAS
ncbi:hypothetical protein AGMMS49579_21140 [Spirochaetia bacterium]|nr:hypothetical protein AGMMS49579_21140 [Spirochaetia bacterium]